MAARHHPPSDEERGVPAWPQTIRSLRIYLPDVAALVTEESIAQLRAEYEPFGVKVTVEQTEDSKLSLATLTEDAALIVTAYTTRERFRESSTFEYLWFDPASQTLIPAGEDARLEGGKLSHRLRPPRFLWDPAPLLTTAHITSDSDLLLAMCIADDRQHVYTIDNGELHVFDGTSSQQVCAVPCPSEGYCRLAVSESRLYVGHDAGLTIIDVSRAASPIVEQTLLAGKKVTQVDPSGEGVLAIADQKLHIVAGQPARILATYSNPVQECGSVSSGVIWLLPPADGGEFSEEERTIHLAQVHEDGSVHPGKSFSLGKVLEPKIAIGPTTAIVRPGFALDRYEARIFDMRGETATEVSVLEARKSSTYVISGELLFEIQSHIVSAYSLSHPASPVYLGDIPLGAKLRLSESTHPALTAVAAQLLLISARDVRVIEGGLLAWGGGPVFSGGETTGAGQVHFIDLRPLHASIAP
jgi:hypothetical protein